MVVLGSVSACFSAAEAAFFSLRKQDLDELSRSGTRGRLVVRMLRDAERLLTAILFGNLLVNILYFTLSSLVTLSWQHRGAAEEASGLATASVLALIFFSEMLPKSLAVHRPKQYAGLLAPLVWLSIELASPFLPIFRQSVIVIRRIAWPSFRPEPYLQVRDLERAVQSSRDRGAILEQEQKVLQNLVELSALRAEEVMRPRTGVRRFHRPLTFAALGHELPPSGYFLIVEGEEEAFTKALPPAQLVAWYAKRAEGEGLAPTQGGAMQDAHPPTPQLDDATQDLAESADPVAYVPWNAPASVALQTLVEEHRSVAAVVNEYGETIGIITADDLLVRIFSSASSRSEVLQKRRPIQLVGPNIWHVTGLANVQRVARYFGMDFPKVASLTIGGVIHEKLGRRPREGDQCHWGPFLLKVLQMGRHGVLLVEMQRILPDPHDADQEED